AARVRRLQATIAAARDAQERGLRTKAGCWTALDDERRPGLGAGSVARGAAPRVSGERVQRVTAAVEQDRTVVGRPDSDDSACGGLRRGRGRAGEERTARKEQRNDGQSSERAFGCHASNVCRRSRFVSERFLNERKTQPRSAGNRITSRIVSRPVNSIVS